MHKSTYLRMEYLVKYYETIFTKNKTVVRVLDIGSFDVNGTYKTIFDDSRYYYTGMDMTDGPNVDLVPKDIYHWEEIADESFDLVISGQVFEHIEYPWLTIKEVERVLKPSGFCIIIAPNSGREHKAPKDCYRYYADGLAALAKWANLNVLHTSISGVPEGEKSGDWVNDWNDGCLVAQKEPSGKMVAEQPFIQERRVPTFGYFDTVRIWEMAVKQAYERFQEKKPVVLFGAGWIGDMALEILGSDKVKFFVDHSKDKIGKIYRGKEVISFDDYQKNSSRYNCIITASYHASLEIMRNMEQAGLRYEGLYLKEL